VLLIMSLEEVGIDDYDAVDVDEVLK